GTQTFVLSRFGLGMLAYQSAVSVPPVLDMGAIPAPARLQSGWPGRLGLKVPATWNVRWIVQPAGKLVIGRNERFPAGAPLHGPKVTCKAGVCGGHVYPTETSDGVGEAGGTKLNGGMKASPSSS